MKSNLSSKNPALIKISVVIFILLLAAYIPLKIHISSEGETEPVAETVSFDIIITRNLSRCIYPGGRCAAGIENTREMIRAGEKGESLLILDYLEIDPAKLEESTRPKQLPVDRLKRIGYHAIAPVIAGESTAEFLSSPRTVFQLPLPLVSANIIPEQDRNHNLRQWVCGDISGAVRGKDEYRDIRIGIFSVSRMDSIEDSYSRFNSYNIINPKIAALEVINRLNREGCHLIIAVCGAGFNEDLRSVPGIDLILEGAGKTRIRSNAENYMVSFGEDSSTANRFRVLFSEDSLKVIPLRS